MKIMLDNERVTDRILGGGGGVPDHHHHHHHHHHRGTVVIKRTRFRPGDLLHASWNEVMSLLPTQLLRQQPTLDSHDTQRMQHLVQMRVDRCTTQKQIANEFPFGVAELPLYPSWASSRAWMNKFMIDLLCMTDIAHADQTVTCDEFNDSLSAECIRLSDANYLAYALATGRFCSVIPRVVQRTDGKLIAGLRYLHMYVGVNDVPYWATMHFFPFPVQPVNINAWIKEHTVWKPSDVVERVIKQPTWSPPSHWYPNVMSKTLAEVRHFRPELRDTLPPEPRRSVLH
jgi:hypothetical protein